MQRLRTYLVVDRSPAVTKRAKDLLVLRGVEPDRVLEAHSGGEAMRAFRDREPEVVLLGVDLPTGGGHEVAQAIWRADPEATIVVQTGLPPSDYRVRQMVEAGAHSLLHRPPREREVADLMNDLDEEEPGLTRIPPQGP